MARAKPNPQNKGRTPANKKAAPASTPKLTPAVPAANRKIPLPPKQPVSRQAETEARNFDTARIKKTAQTEPLPAFTETARAQFAEQTARTLPDNYGDNLIYAMVRDPYWIFVYWELQAYHVDSVLRTLQAVKEDTSTILRVYDLSSCEKGTCFFDIQLQGMVRNWYIHVHPGRRYVVEIGLLHKDGRFAALARSNVVEAPRATMSDVLDEKWAGAEMDKIYAAAAGGGNLSTNGRSSEEVRRLVEKHLLSGLTSGSGGAILSGVSSASGRPVQIGRGKQRGFWFVLDCEVIVYGATEPDARVTLQGREMKLRPDGTFSARFALPDGRFVFEAKAFSADGVEERTITPIVQRETERPAPNFLKEF